MTVSTGAVGARPRLMSWLRRGAAALALASITAAALWLARPRPTAVESALPTVGRLLRPEAPPGGTRSGQRRRVGFQSIVSVSMAISGRSSAAHSGLTMT